MLNPEHAIQRTLDTDGIRHLINIQMSDLDDENLGSMEIHIQIINGNNIKIEPIDYNAPYRGFKFIFEGCDEIRAIKKDIEFLTKMLDEFYEEKKGGFVVGKFYLYLMAKTQQ